MGKGPDIGWSYSKRRIDETLLSSLRSYGDNFAGKDLIDNSEKHETRPGPKPRPFDVQPRDRYRY